MRRKNPKFENQGERRSSDDDNRNSGNRRGSGRSSNNKSRGGRKSNSSDNRRGSSGRDDSRGDRKPSAGGGFGRREGKSRPSGDRKPIRSFDKDKKENSDSRNDSRSIDRRDRSDSHRNESSDRRKSFSRSDRSDRSDRADRRDNRRGDSFDHKKPYSRSDRSDRKPTGDRRDFEKRDGDNNQRGKKSYDNQRNFGGRKDGNNSDDRGRSGSRSFGNKRDSGVKRSFDRKEGDSERPTKRKFGTDKREFDRAKVGRKFRPRTQKQEPVVVDDGLIRLNKYIANAGICSRRQADEYIKTGLVEVNGTVITEMGFKVKSEDDVRFDGSRISPEKKTYVLLNKPKGYITTTNDEHDRKTVMELVANATNTRLFPVGRLDRQTTGVLLFTNDGYMSKKLTHPSHNIKKIYHVVLDKDLHGDDMEKIRQGIPMHEGLAKVDKVSFIDGKGHNEVGVEIHIGWNRVVRRLFEKLGYKVEALDRVQFAGLTKKNVKRGQWRVLNQKEVSFLKMM